MQVDNYVGLKMLAILNRQAGHTQLSAPDLCRNRKANRGLREKSS